MVKRTDASRVASQSLCLKEALPSRISGMVSGATPEDRDGQASEAPGVCPAEAGVPVLSHCLVQVLSC